MSTESHFSTSSSSSLQDLFPSGVVVVERTRAGDPADLLPSELHYVKRSVAKRVQEFAAGRACARRALVALGWPAGAIEPAADRSPRWPEGCVGTITHTEGFCAAALAPTTVLRAIGLDTEVVGAPTPDIWPTIANESESRWIAALAADERAAAITLLFSAKEAFYKCQYPLTGEWLDFHDLHIEALEWGAPHGRFLVRPSRPIRFEDHAPPPVLGRFRFHGRLLSAAIAIGAMSTSIPAQ